ncbi:MAG TPA: hypothetical protein VEQ67_04945 [Mycobacterium sp.]|nr:hypothetical protein [Mycobacterium sp.]
MTGAVAALVPAKTLLFIQWLMVVGMIFSFLRMFDDISITAFR